MGRQYNKVEKRQRHHRYLKRKQMLAKGKTAVKAKPAPPVAPAEVRIAPAGVPAGPAEVPAAPPEPAKMEPAKMEPAKPEPTA